jgi:hypothetical protein
MPRWAASWAISSRIAAKIHRFQRTALPGEQGGSAVICTVLCTGVESLHWSLHWYGCGGPGLPGLDNASGMGAITRAGLDQSALLEGMGARTHRARGNAQPVGDLGGFDASLPELNELGLVGGGHQNSSSGHRVIRASQLTVESPELAADRAQGSFPLHA